MAGVLVLGVGSGAGVAVGAGVGVAALGGGGVFGAGGGGAAGLFSAKSKASTVFSLT